MQSPSSLIFLVLLGVWAAYFVQYWVRRRDHVATARSVEQFSTAMRVLEKRDALPRTDLSEPSPRSYAVHPSRAARPQVLVKRAVAAEPPAPGRVTERVDAARPAPAPPARPAADSPRRPVEPRPAPRPRVRPSRRVRGLIFLVAVLELVTIVPLVALSLLPVWALAPAVLALVGSLAFVRSGVRTEAALLRAHRRRAADLERLRRSAPVAPRAAATPARATRPAAPAAPTSASSVPETGPVLDDEAFGEVVLDDATAEVGAGEPVVVESAVVSTTAAPRPRRDVIDIPLLDPVLEVSAPAPSVPQPAAEDVMVPIDLDDDIPLTWDPVPVPRPTYTMKAKAERREVAPAAVTPDPAPVARDAADESTYEQRRVAGA
ncbi:hypothetical protein ACK8HX_17555 [Oryzobacter sp. R7]|uniref:hypothetical protein n=1 Tax=Oryzobacter faecalis TaxID=3388656 RepID=UPI00398C9FAA